MDLKNKSILILPHNKPDVDAIASAIALAEAFRPIAKEVEIGVSGELKAGAKIFLEKVREEAKENFSLEKDLIFCVDSNSPALIPRFDEVMESSAKKIVIDHHHLQFSENFDEIWSKEEKVSTTEILKEFLEEQGLEFTPTIWLCIAAGIFGDLPKINLATPESLEVLSEAGKKSRYSLKEIYDMTVPVRTIPERISCLKSASRMEIHRFEDWIIATSFTGSYGGSAASSLLELGADVSFVASEKEDDFDLVSARAVKELEGKEFHLGRDVMPKIKQAFGGDGGGHATAAGAAVEGPASIQEILGKCVEFSKERLKEIR